MKFNNDVIPAVTVQGYTGVLVIVMVALSPLALAADIVELKNGKVYRNVKAIPMKGGHRIQFANRRIINIPNQEIRKVRIKSVKWPRRIVKKKPVFVAPVPAVPEAPLPDEGWDMGPVWKSTLLPGWGQYSLNEKGRAVAFFSGSMLALQRYWQERSLHNDAQEAYSEQLTPTLLATQGLNGYAIFLVILEQEKAVLLQREQSTNQMVTMLSLVWAWNVLDALILSNPRITESYPILKYLRFNIADDAALNLSGPQPMPGINRNGDTGQPESRQPRFSLGFRMQF